MGREEQLESLFQELKERPASGSPGQKLEFAGEALVLMKTRPGHSFKCGPYALDRIQALLTGRRDIDQKIMDARSSSKGFSLDQVHRLAGEVGLDLRMARREPGAPVLTPAVVHWKSGHFGALLLERDGLYLVEDRTFGERLWVSEAALDDEASGVFLVPPGDLGDLPAGWTDLSEQAAKEFWGKGLVAGRDPRAFTDCDHKSGGNQGSCCGLNQASSRGMAEYSVHTMMANLNIKDTPVGHTPPAGPAIPFTVTYNQMDSFQAAIFNYPNLGTKWSFNWLSFIHDVPSQPGASVNCYLPGGGVHTFIYDSGNAFKTHQQSQATLVRVSTTPIKYELSYPDGTKLAYEEAAPDAENASKRRVFLKKWTDPQGLQVVLTYEQSYYRLIDISDSLGQHTTITYLGNDSNVSWLFYTISKVTDPFGRSAIFSYDANVPPRLITIKDVAGLTSSFGYTGDLVNSMTTAYGTTTFTWGSAFADYNGQRPGLEEANAWVQIQDPTGAERVQWQNYLCPETEPECSQDDQYGPLCVTCNPCLYPTYPGEENDPPDVPVFNCLLHVRNSFYWDRKAMETFQLAGNLPSGDSFADARVFHWQHGANELNNDSVTSGALESFEEPLHNRVFFYPSFESAFLPQTVATRVEGPDGVTGADQVHRYEYNLRGKITKVTDPVGRETQFVYDTTTSLDLKEVNQKNGGTTEKLLEITYHTDHPHLPITIKDAAGKNWNFTWTTSKHQLATFSNPKTPAETTTFSYDANGYLITITGPQSGATTTLTWDGYGRVRTATDSEGYSLTHHYDALDRPTRITYSDGTFEEVTYGVATTPPRPLDVTSYRDRQGRVTTYTYDQLRRLTQEQDPLGRITNLGWCSCGGLDSLTTYKDGVPQVTTWERDLTGRVIGKTFPDGLAAKKYVYVYEPRSGRFQEIKTGKKNGSLARSLHYKYYLDDNVKEISYPNALITTQPVTFTYDAMYNRMTRMTDQMGNTDYAYNAITVPAATGAGLLTTIDGPVSGTTDRIQFSYDELGRVLSRTVNVTSMSVTYDSLGRLATVNNPLNLFTYTYLNKTPRLQTITSTGNKVKTEFTYLPNLMDQQLEEIKNLRNTSTPLSKFNYSYDASGLIRSWSQQADSATPTVYELGYDKADQLRWAIGLSSVPADNKTYSYTYDTAGNRKSEQVSNPSSHTVHSFSYDADNQLLEVNGNVMFR